MMRISGQKIPLETLLLATIADRLGILAWQNSADGQKGKNRPASILSELLNEKEESSIKTYESGADFDRARKLLLKGGIVYE